MDKKNQKYAWKQLKKDKENRLKKKQDREAELREKLLGSTVRESNEGFKIVLVRRSSAGSSILTENITSFSGES